MLFDGFKHFVNTMLAGILFTLAVVVGLVFLLIANITFYILSDHPEMECNTAMARIVMKGGFFWKVLGMGILRSS